MRPFMEINLPVTKDLLLRRCPLADRSNIKVNIKELDQLCDEIWRQLLEDLREVDNDEQKKKTKEHHANRDVT